MPDMPQNAVKESKTPKRAERPSLLYRADTWRIGLAVSRRLSPKSAQVVAMWIAKIYSRINSSRRQTVVSNLLPATNGDLEVARAATDALFENFAIKLLDLWRYENGLPIDHLINGWSGWEHFEIAQARGRGVLIITPHLGNWEFGAPLLAAKRVPLLVITMVEPHAGLTEMRQSARAHWGIETLVLGKDPFAFVDVIRRLEKGAAVALLIDRPPAASAVTVELFGKPFSASIAAAELARASGCALLPVFLPRESAGYRAHMLPEIHYERRLLSHAGRERLTQDIMRVFEPVIRLHIAQWYHFIPIWRPVNKGSNVDQTR